MARILHIEDNASNRLLVRKVLSGAGHEVIDATTGPEGIALAAKEKPDVVLVDLHIPELDGYEVILRLRGMGTMRKVPIVAVTGVGDKQTALAVGADGFVAKPIDAARLPAIVGRFLGGHRERGDKTGPIRLREKSQKIVEHLEDRLGALSRANDQLEEMARLRMEFLRNVSHELATPMTPIVGYLKLLLDGELGPVTPLQRKTLESINASTTRLRSVINTLLDVSSLESGNLHFYSRDYNVGEVLGKALKDVRPSFDDAGVAIFVEKVPDGAVAKGDGEKLRRALVHVLDNGAKFTPRGSSVGVAVRPVGQGPSEGFLFIVADDGPGVAKTELDRILEPFFQADGSVTRRYGGVGLGLAFARSVAEAMGGRLEVQSPPVEKVAGRSFSGTAVCLFVRKLPAPPPAAPATPATPPPTPPAR